MLAQTSDADTNADVDQDARRLLCRAGALLWAVPLRRVLEVMRALPITPVAGAPPYVVGLSIIRGAPLPVVDIGMMVSETPTRIERFVTVRTPSRSVALAAEAVPGIWAVDPQAVGQLPPLLRDVGANIIAAVGRLDAELLFLMRDTSIVPEDVLRSLDPEGAEA